MIKGFTMKLYEGQEVEYEKRHNLLWGSVVLPIPFCSNAS